MQVQIYIAGGVTSSLVGLLVYEHDSFRGFDQGACDKIL